MQPAKRYIYTTPPCPLQACKDNRKISPPAAIVAAKPILSYRGDESSSARGKYPVSMGMAQISTNVYLMIV